eukprot:CAMPEP_0119143366 /NCGR_PEP_ID=MMETSP1310-20130426/34228_1 /TAXON_ID=464262 /ORGANISM="Genus nov. species nov., Strain RCC2339" /LENGTH=37 /DNA_ID= /DNA_START= /DNA_END= /DNA_ORIENTATION=
MTSAMLFSKGRAPSPHGKDSRDLRGRMTAFFSRAKAF